MGFESVLAFAFTLGLAFGLSLPTAEDPLLDLMDLSEEKDHLGDDNILGPSLTV